MLSSEYNRHPSRCLAYTRQCGMPVMVLWDHSLGEVHKLHTDMATVLRHIGHVVALSHDRLQQTFSHIQNKVWS